MRAPAFWQQKGALSTLLMPVAAVYQAAGKIRARMIQPYEATVPVICVGNITAGGAGKTPTVLAIVESLKQQKRNPHILSPGYRARLKGPLRVDPALHSHEDVGDEALLLARAAPVWIGRNRGETARAATAAGADILVMDDGLQNPTLKKDFSIVVMDGGFGLGNERLIPAGPLRETLRRVKARTDLYLVIGEDRQHLKDRLPADKAIHGVLRPTAKNLKNRRIIAFAGIGRPQKFFDTLTACGAELAASFAFADHHVFTPVELEMLSTTAQTLKAELWTTEKDAVRLPQSFRKQVQVLPVTLETDRPWHDMLAGITR